MTIAELLNDKLLKSKIKTETLKKWLLDGKISADELILFAKESKDSIKATCIEGIEFATKQKPEVANTLVFKFVTSELKSKAPRVKWESAKVIGNTASFFKSSLDEAIVNLLINTKHDGTVVRWSAAYALSEILKLKTKHYKNLLPLMEVIVLREEKNSIKKIYLDAIKKTTK